MKTKLFAVFLVIAFIPEIRLFEIRTQKDAADYLKVFGYYPPDDDTENSVSSYLFPHSRNKKKKMFTESLLAFQHFSGLEKTGRLDDATLAMMNKPRCGMPERMDVDQNKQMTTKKLSHKIARRGKWKSSRIFYKIDSFPKLFPKNLDEDTVRMEIRRAFKLWEDVANLECVELKGDDERMADIDIRFVVGEHGDGSAFGNFTVGNVAAHAFFPNHHRFQGDVHFDDDKHWSAFTLEGVNLFQAAAHEFGHALGLEHSHIMDSVMHMHLKDQLLRDFKLHEDDIMGIQNLYGRRRRNLILSNDNFQHSFTNQTENEWNYRDNFPKVSSVTRGPPMKKEIMGQPVLVYSVSLADGNRSFGKGLNSFWNCFTLLYDTNGAKKLTDCYTKSVSKMLNSLA